MYLILSRFCSHYLDVIDRPFVFRNCFHFLFAKVFSTQFKFIQVNTKVQLAKFQEKPVICESLFLKSRDYFSSQMLLFTYIFALKGHFYSEIFKYIYFVETKTDVIISRTSE